MRLSHTLARMSVAFDDPNLVSPAGLVPVLALAERAGLADLADEHLSVPTDKGANAGLKVASLVAGMVAGADSIDDMALLRHGGMGRVFARAYAPSTLGSFLRAFTFGHVRQLDAVAARFLLALAALLGLRPPPPDAGDSGGFTFVDVDDTIVEVHGHAKQGAGFGYTRVRGLNALIATLTTPGCAPLVVAQRLRKGACGSPRGAQRLVGDAVKQTRRLLGEHAPVLVRMDSAYYGRDAVHAAITGGAAVSVTVRLDPAVKAAIASIPDDAWTTIKYPNAILDEATGTWVSKAEVAEVPYTAFTSKKKADRVPGRLVVRRIPDVHASKKQAAGQGALFDLWRFHAFFTTVPAEQLDTVAADSTHRGHAIIEQVHADLKASALAHLPSGRFTANSAWLVLAVIAFNLTRAAAALTAAPELVRATTATVRRKLIHVPARVATSARRITLHLPQHWPWQPAWTHLFDRVA
ncbi:MAG TPA: IS1380 family transposase, partial [Ornithinibacter sp.]|nr:IS1380 family transposase [Ornithinibacter sp.]